MAKDLLSDGFIALCIDSSLNFYEGKSRVLIEGQYLSSGATPATADVPIAVNSVASINALFGDRSQLSFALRKAFATCPSNVQFYGLPRADAGGAIAAEHTVTFSGPTTEAGRYSAYLGDHEFNIDVYIPSGSSDVQIATLVAAEINSEFPFTAVVGLAGLITFTAANAGQEGNRFKWISNWHERQNYQPAGLGVTVVLGTVAGVGDPPALDLITVLAGCCYRSVITLNDNTDMQTALHDYLTDAWDCAKPQCFGRGFVYNCGSVGTVIAKGNNSVVLSRMDYCCDDTKSFPWGRVAAYGALAGCYVDNPEISIQGRTLGVLDAIREPQECANCRTYDEQVNLKENAFVVTGQLSGGSGALTSIYVFNDVTNNLTDELGRENVTFKSGSSRRLAEATALSLAAELQTYNGLGLYTKNTTIKQGVFGTNPRLMLAGIRAWAKEQIGVLFSEFDNIDEDITLKTDFEVALECQGRPDLLHLNVVYRPPVRIGQINTLLQPSVLDNCNR